MNEFEVNNLMSLTGIVLIPVIIWFIVFNITLRTKIIGMFFIILFSKGFLELIGVPVAISTLTTELFLGIMIVLFKSNKERQYPGLIIIFGIFITGIFSTINNESNLVQFILFFREYFEVILFMYIIINIRLSENEIQFLFRLLAILFISQIGANIIKVIILQDIVEPYIGTIAVLGGSKTTLFALIGGSFCIVHYLLTSKRIYLLGILGFIIFSLLGGKRATILYFPIIYLISYLIFHFKYRMKREIVFKKLSVIVISVFLLFYITARLLPTLNPEKEIGGSFDLDYIIDYSTSYATADYINDIGRSEAPSFLVLKSLNDGYDKTLIGYGTGRLIKSGFNVETVDLSSDEITKSNFGVGYAARTGFLQFFLQIGLIGVILMLFFFLFLASLIWKIKTKPVYLRFFSILLILVMMLDYFTYSCESILFSAIGCSIFFILGLTLQNRSK